MVHRLEGMTKSVQPQQHLGRSRFLVCWRHRGSVASCWWGYTGRRRVSTRPPRPSCGCCASTTNRPPPRRRAESAARLSFVFVLTRMTPKSQGRPAIEAVGHCRRGPSEEQARPCKGGALADTECPGGEVAGHAIQRHSSEREDQLVGKNFPDEVTLSNLLRTLTV